MPGNMSNYLVKKVLDDLLGNGAFTPPATIYLALFHTAGPGDNNANVANEITDVDTAYARVACTWDAAVLADRKALLAALTQFAIATDDYDGDVVAWGLYDSVTRLGGNLLFWGEWQTPREILQNDRFEADEDDLELGCTATA